MLEMREIICIQKYNAMKLSEFSLQNQSHSSIYVYSYNNSKKNSSQVK